MNWMEWVQPLGFVDTFVPLALSLVLGAIVGVERLIHTQSTGARTHMLVAMGSAGFVLAAKQAFGDSDDNVTRIVQGVASGIGFIGAGAILKLSQPAEIRGLTTAATVWLSSSVGVACGLGAFRVAVWATGLAMVVLAVLRPYERRIEIEHAKQREAEAKKEANSRNILGD